MKESPFFSIVMATHNDYDCFCKAIESINCQTYTDYELLISDGGSSDETLSFLQSGSVRNLSWYKSTPDGGIYDALNIALSRVSGLWVIVLGSDDLLHDEKSLKQAHDRIVEVSEDDSVGLIYSDIMISSEGTSKLKEYPEYQRFKRAYWGCPFVHHQSAFVSREAIGQFQEYDLRYSVHADYDHMMKVLNVFECRKIKGAFVVYNSAGYSSKLYNILKSINEVMGIRLKNGCFPMPPRLIITYMSVVANTLRSVIMHRNR